VPQALSQTPRWAHAAALSLLFVGGWAALAPFLDAWFWGGDDWLHLEHARLFADGHPIASFAARVADYRGTGQAALRQVSTALWGVDMLLFGARPWAYYGTNIAVHVLNALLGCVLVVRWSRSAWAGLLCGALYLLNARTTEVVWFLAVRSEALALTFSLLTVLAWPRVGRGWGGRALVAALFTAALFSKATAGFLPLVLVAHDVAFLPRSRWIRPGRLLADYAPVALALGLYALAVFTLLDLRETMSYVPEGHRTFAAEAGIVLRAAWDAVVTPYWTASYGPVARPAAAVARAGLVGTLLVAGLLAGRGPRILWLIGAAWTVGGLGLPWGLIARGFDFGRYFLPSTLGLGLLAAAGLASLERWRWLRWPARGLATAAIVASGLAFHEPDAMAFHVDLGRGVQSAVEALRDEAAERGAVRDATLVLPSPMRGLVELVQRETTLALLLPDGAPRRVRLLGEGTDLLLAERDHPGFDAGGVPHCSAYIPRKEGFDLAEVDRDQGGVVLYQRTIPSGRPRVLPAFAIAPPLGPAPAPDGVFDGPSEALWVMGGAEAAEAWTHSGFDGQSNRSALPTLRDGGVVLETSGRLNPPNLQQALLNHQPPALVSPLLDLAPQDVCALRIDIEVHPRGRHPNPFTCALEPAYFGVLFWTDSDDPQRLSDHHILLPLRADGHRETVTVRLRNSPPWQTAERVRRLGLVPASEPAAVRLRQVELVGCGFEEGP
jgi:hypothetical protein